VSRNVPLRAQLLALILQQLSSSGSRTRGPRIPFTAAKLQGRGSGEYRLKGFCKHGGRGRNRTYNLSIKSRILGIYPFVPFRGQLTHNV
jgi:hypothetical protein